MDHTIVNCIRRRIKHYNQLNRIKLFQPLNDHPNDFPQNLLRRKHGNLQNTYVPNCSCDGYSACTEGEKWSDRNNIPPSCISEQHGHEDYKSSSSTSCSQVFQRSAAFLLLHWAFTGINSSIQQASVGLLPSTRNFLGVFCISSSPIVIYFQ